MRGLSTGNSIIRLVLLRDISRSYNLERSFVATNVNKQDFIVKELFAEKSGQHSFPLIVRLRMGFAHFTVLLTQEVLSVAL